MKTEPLMGSTCCYCRVLEWSGNIWCRKNWCEWY